LESNIFNRVIKILLIALLLAGMVIVYDWEGYHNFSSQEAMDSAQLARNLSQGKGYTTYFVRPFSIFLLQRKIAAARGSAAAIGAEAARVNNNHPDLANPPVYPVFLAGLMKAFKFHYEVYTNKSFWSSGGYFQRYEPEFKIALANQALLIGAIFLTFFIARKIFDQTAAWIAALLVAASNLLWQFSVSGLSTILLMDLFLCLVIALLKFEEANAQPEPKKSMLWIVAMGLILAAGMLTRYSFGWLFIPAAVYLVLFGGPRRALYVLTMAAAFAVPVIPWLLRNLSVSGTWFGVSGYAVAEDTIFFQGADLENSTHPFLSGLIRLTPYLLKLKANLHLIFENDLTHFSGTWILMLFFTGLLLGFRSQTAKRIRYFTVFCLVTFVFVQALGRTHLSDDVPVLNSENLLVLLAPMTFIYGAVFFLIIVDQIKLPFPQMRYIAIGVLVLMESTALIAHVWPPQSNPLSYPPYHPPDIQKAGRLMKQNELIMSDVPWAVAWYGQRECVSLPLKPTEEFYNINDYVKPVSALYLTEKSLNIDLLPELTLSHPDSDTWRHFVLTAGIKNQLPNDFPLNAVSGYVSGILLTDHPR
jgi:4-amino-4-deoxy-L-arabinose transferase-like glycosyltransferase